MNRTLQAILASLLIGLIMFSGIVIAQAIGRAWRLDVTEQKLYTLSDGTRAILAKLNQPISLKLYYAKTGANKAPDQIKYFNNYYIFVRDTLAEYARAGGGMVDLELIDPRPFSDDEQDALRHGLKRFPITEEENFFFGLVIQTQFGVVKTIDFFSPDRQNFLEYDISYLIDTAITRQKKRIGIISSLDVVGEEITPYMAQMRQMQGQPPATPPWSIVQQLKRQYEVKDLTVDVKKPIEDVDILLAIHPKALPQETLFAIDQFVLAGGRAIVAIDPHCIMDRADPMAMQMGQMDHSSSSDLGGLLSAWGLQMKTSSFVGDRDLATDASMTPNERPQKIITFLNLSEEKGCFGKESPISGDLNTVRVLFAGALSPSKVPSEDGTSADAIQYRPLLQTTNRGNTFALDRMDLMMPNSARLMGKYTDGTEPVVLGYLATGKFKSAFPSGPPRDTTDEDTDDEGADDEDTADEDTADDNSEPEPEPAPEPAYLSVSAGSDCAVVVFSDVDFISDMLAYQNTFFGKATVGDNAALMLNAIEDLGGSSELISIRSRGNYNRPFSRIDRIEAQAEQETAQEVANIQAQITGFNQELSQLKQPSTAQEKALIESSVIEKIRQIELQQHQAQAELLLVNRHKRQQIEDIGNMLRNINMLAAPAAILLLAILVGLRRSVLRRRYISHASDA